MDIGRAGRRLMAAGAIGVMMLAAAAPALADCYDLLGCSNKDAFSKHYSYLADPQGGPTCDFLYQMRNRIYAEHGYCFKTARGVSEIGNDGCHISDMTKVPLSQLERNNIATIQKAERAKRCPA
jgi:hypothetical protein